jgi:hypothetical protein
VVRARRFVSLFAAVFALSGCTGEGSESGPAAPVMPAGGIPTDATPAEASDGGDLDACADGECEVEVPSSGSTTIPIDPDFGFGKVIVEFGEGQVRVHDGDGFIELTGGTGGGTSPNDGYTFAFEVRSVEAGAAVIAIAVYENP